jgi:sugar phosphate isomerase/epimerase
MWTLSGFADEISPELSEQIDILLAEEMSYLEFRGVWGKNVLDLSDEELDRVRRALQAHGLGVSSIGSPIGKILVTDDFEEHLVRFRRALEIAHFFGAPYVRIFSFFIPRGDTPARHRDEVLRRMAAFAKAAGGSDVVLLHENEKEIYGDVPERCHDVLASVGSEILRSTWDAANFVQCGIQPFTEGYQMLRPFIEYMQVKDAFLATGEVVAAGRGDGQTRETLAALRDDGFDGFFSLEPHLESSGRFSGTSGPELFRVAVHALKDLFRELEVPSQPC